MTHVSPAVLEHQALELRAECDRLRAALERAAHMIAGEYCSHDGACGAREPYCYARFIFIALTAAPAPVGNGLEK